MVAGGGVDIEGGAAGGGAAMGGCGAVCFEPDGVKTEERWVYKGAGMGSYAQVGSMEMVGMGKGDFEKEKTVVATGTRMRFACIGMICFAFLLTLLIAGLWLFGSDQPGFSPPMMDDPACDVGLPNLAALDEPLKTHCCDLGVAAFCEVLGGAPAPKPVDKIVIHDKYYTHVKNVHVPHMVPVPIPPPPRRVITHKVYVHTAAYDCTEGLSVFKSQWSPQHQRYCCYKSHVACTTKVTYRPHYHTITHVKHVTVPVHVPVPAPPARVINHIVNVPIHDAPQVIKVPVPGHPHVVPKYIHEKHYVPVPEPSAPKYHSVPVPVPVKEPGEVIKVPVPLPPKTIVKNKVIYRTRHVKVKHVYDCDAGFENWKYGWSSSKQSWCCSHKSKGCAGTWHGDGLTKSVVTHVTEHVGHGHSYVESPSVVHVHHYHHYKSGSSDVDGNADVVGGDVTYGGSYDGGDADVVGGDVTYDGGDDGEFDGATDGGSFGSHSWSSGGSWSGSHSWSSDDVDLEKKKK